MSEKKPIDVINGLTEINTELFSIWDKLKAYDLDFGLANQYIRDTIMEISKTMSKIVIESENDKS